MKRVTLLLVALTALSFTVLFAGCGQSGALYIPGNPSEIAVPPGGENDEPEEADPSNTE